ncbi:MAG: glycoside hydrolase domain-containing protein, partial [Anaerolineales bacterium]
HASVSLNPFDSCWPSDGLDLSNITRMEFHTRDNGTVNGNSGLWDDGDELTLWFDNLRLVDQNNGAIQWQTVSGVSVYYIYFDVLTHEGHPLPNTVDTISGTPVPTVVAAPEAGGYYHQITGGTIPSGWGVWTAPTVEKITRGMPVPVDSAPLQISAARGEFESFQIIVNAPAQTTATVTVSDFTYSAANTQYVIRSTNPITAPEIHQVEYVDVTTAGDHFDRFGDWPDPLWPLDNGDTVSVTAGENLPLWFTVQVPWNAAAGTYQGTVTVGSTTIPVELEVWDFSLPQEIHLVSEWGLNWTNLVEDYRGTVGGSVQSCYWQVVDALKQQFIDYRLIPKGVAWPAGLNYPGGVDYDCNGNLDPDAWGEWDFATLGGKYVHGEQGFNGGVGFPEFLAFGPASNWPPDSLPYSFCGASRSGTLGDAQYQAKWTQYLSALDAYIVSDDYADAAYYHIVNEPQTDSDYDITGQISALTESAAPNLRQMVSEQVEPQIYNYAGAKIDVWMPTITNYEPEKSHERQKNYGEEVWWYYLYGDDPPLPNPILMSHPGVEARITPWLAWSERVDGLLHYSIDDWSSNPWTTPNVTGQDNGDGFFLYPPHQDGTPLDACGENGHRLVPSIRWVNLRDGMEDYEYLWLLAGGDPQVDVTNPADAYVAQIVSSRTLFSRVPTDLLDARAAIAAAIMGTPTGSTAIKTASAGGVEPGGTLTYTLSYYHTSTGSAQALANPITLTVTDTLPAETAVITAAGPGSVTINGQTVYWTTPVTNSTWVSLDITAQATLTPAAVTNTAYFSAEEDFTASVTVVIYEGQVFLPVVNNP